MFSSICVNTIQFNHRRGASYLIGPGVLCVPASLDGGSASHVSVPFLDCSLDIAFGLCQQARTADPVVEITLAGNLPSVSHWEANRVEI